MKAFKTIYFSQSYGQAGLDFIDRYALEKDVSFPGKKPPLLPKKCAFAVFAKEALRKRILVTIRICFQKCLETGI